MVRVVLSGLVTVRVAVPDFSALPPGLNVALPSLRPCSTDTTVSSLEATLVLTGSVTTMSKLSPTLAAAAVSVSVMITGGIMLAEPAELEPEALSLEPDWDALAEDDELVEADADALVDALPLADAADDEAPPELLDDPHAASATVAAPAVSTNAARVS